MGFTRKIQNKFAEFRQADHKMAWLADEWYWRYFTFRHKKQIPINLAFDREHGVETAVELPLESAGVPLDEVERGNGVYRPLTESLFRTSLASINIDAARFTFIDVGSGKGKVMFMAIFHGLNLTWNGSRVPPSMSCDCLYYFLMAFRRVGERPGR